MRKIVIRIVMLTAALAGVAVTITGVASTATGADSRADSETGVVVVATEGNWPWD